MRLINEIGTWVLREACKTAAAWPEPLKVAVNLSPRQFEAGDVCNIVASALREAGLAPHRLKLEINEILLLANTVAILTELRALKTSASRSSWTISARARIASGTSAHH